MTEQNPPSPLSLAERIEVIEQAYELMLAYAAQGRQNDADDSSSIRRFLQRADAALDGLAACLREVEGGVFDGVEGPPPETAAQARELRLARVSYIAEICSGGSYADFIAVLEGDARSTRAALRLVLAARTLSSQLIDNLNASIHIRALLTDIFLIDETLKNAAADG